MKNLFANLVQPKKSFCRKATPSSISRKLAHSLINIALKDMDKFEEIEMMEMRRFTKNTWYDFLIHHIPEPTKSRE